MNMSTQHSIIFFTIWLATALFSCGDNVYKSQEKTEPAEDAVLELENGNPNKAIDILEAALVDDPGNPKYLSVLSYAYAARAGVEPLKLVSKMTTTASGEEASENELILLFGVVPEATEDTLADIDKAVSILVLDIAADDRLPGDTLKLAIFQTASLVMHLKAIDTDGDGELELEEIADFSDLSAASLLNQLASAQVLLASSDPDDQTSLQAAEALGKYQSQIDAMPGATNEEKLKNYLAGSPPAT